MANVTRVPLFLLTVLFALLTAVAGAQPASPEPETISVSEPVSDGEGGWLVTFTGQRAIGVGIYNGAVFNEDGTLARQLAEVELVSISDSRQPLVCSQQPGVFVCLALLDGEVPPSITLRVRHSLPTEVTLPITVTDSTKTVSNHARTFPAASSNAELPYEPHCAYLPLVGR